MYSHVSCNNNNNTIVIILYVHLFPFVYSSIIIIIMLTKLDCFQFLHHMHHPGCLYYHHRGWVYILMHRSIKLP